MYSPPNRARIRALPSRASAALISPSPLGIAAFLLFAVAVLWPVAARGQSATLDAPEEIGIGGDVTVHWTGPGLNYEPIVLVEEGAADDAKALLYVAILNGKNPVVVRAPELPGRYELRYVSKDKEVLARRALRVVDVPAGLEAPAVAKPGSTLSVEWSGPGRDYDQVALHPAGAADDARALSGGAILSGRNPVSVRLPDQAGDYELRYVTTRSKRILARRALRIALATASLDAPETATAATEIAVSWTGPGNDYDQIAVVPRGAPDDAEPVSARAILNGRDPLRVVMPAEAGAYDLVYRTASSHSVLVRRAIDVQPSGRLRVVFEREGAVTEATGAAAVEIILDASGSMLQRANGTRRIDIARSVLDELVREHLAERSQLALRVFGHRETDSCRTDLEIPLGPLDRAAAAERIAGVDAMNLARTPIADSLAKVPSDLAGAKGPKTVVLITDGEETCDGDPEAVIADLRSSGFELQISIIGFAIDDAELEATFRRWAALGGGGYFEARSVDELARSLRTVISGPFRVLDSGGREVAEGIVGGAEVVLPAGTYRVELVGSDRGEMEVEIVAGELETLEIR